MVETLTGAPSSSAVADAAQLLHDFNVEYDEPALHPMSWRLDWRS